MSWDAKVFINVDGRTTQLVINMTGEIIFEATGVKSEVKKAWREYADKYGLVVLNGFDGKQIHNGLSTYNSKVK